MDQLLNIKYLQPLRFQLEICVDETFSHNCYYSFKIFPRFWLVKTARIIHHNQLLLTKCWTNDFKSTARWKLLKRWCQNDAKSAARCRLLNRWLRKPGDKVVFFGEKKNKERNGETPLRTRKYFEWIIKQLLNSAFVGYEEFADLEGCYPPWPSASVDNKRIKGVSF